ncbi:MAG: hypothetical protein HYT93_01990 [Parcubacteria group bacterium]|nr:hypothetical protein [Parcubacteria group bacterium]
MKPSVQFQFGPFDESEVLKTAGLILAFGFQEQEDPQITRHFRELEERRKRIDKIQEIKTEKEEEIVTIQSIERDGKFHHVAFIYIDYPWRKKKEIIVEGINFLREVFYYVKLAVERIKLEGHEHITVILPDRFSPRNLQDKAQRVPLYQFVKTVAEAIVYGNEPYNDFKTVKEAKIKTVDFLFFGESDKMHDGFFSKAITDGEIVGRYLAKTRRLTEMPPNVKTPIRFISEVVEKEISEKRFKDKPEAGWKKISVSGPITASVLWGKKTLAHYGFNLINAVNAGSKHEPCILKLHYKPRTERKKRIRKIVFTGKGILFDTGGIDLKGAEGYDNMAYDMCGGATVCAMPFLAEEFNLPVEIVALVPITENMIGENAILPGSIIRAYNDITVKIVNTDCEGRLVLADTIAYAEKGNPDAVITLGTLGDITDFAPDMLKVGTYGKDTVKKARRARRLSAEKMLLLPAIEDFNKVDEEHVGKHSDIVNDVSQYHSSPFIFLFNFFKTDMPWFFVDNSVIFEDDAQDYGAGPGFGMKFIWELLRQYV